MVFDREDEETVIAAASMVEKKNDRANAIAEAARLAESMEGWSDKEFSAAVIRTNAWVTRLFAFIDEFEASTGKTIEVYGIESFVDQRSRAKEEKARLIANRWHTPLVMGMMIVGLAQRGATIENGGVVYQNAGIVIRQFSSEIARLANRKVKKSSCVIPGDQLVTNDHTRKAFAHGLALSTHLRKARSTNSKGELAHAS